MAEGKKGWIDKNKEEIAFGIVYGIVGGLVFFSFGAVLAKSDSALAISLISLALSIATFFLKLTVDVLRKPELSIQFIQKPPDCHLVTVLEMPFFYGPAEHFRYYFALRVWNNGKVKAENVKVKLTDLYVKLNNNWELKNEINPDQLLWRLSGKSFEPTINPQTFEHCNIGYIIHPGFRQKLGPKSGENNPALQIDPFQTIFHIQLSAPSTNLSYLLPPGIYKFGLEASCSNGNKIRKEFELNLRGFWTESEEVMFKEGIQIREVAK